MSEDPPKVTFVYDNEGYAQAFLGDSLQTTGVYDWHEVAQAALRMAGVDVIEKSESDMWNVNEPRWRSLQDLLSSDREQVRKDKLAQIVDLKNQLRTLEQEIANG